MQCSEEKDFWLLRKVIPSYLQFLQVLVNKVSYSGAEFSSIEKKNIWNEQIYKNFK